MTKVKKGKTILTVRTTPEGAKRLVDLFKQGKLSKLAGVAAIDVAHIAPAPIMIECDKCYGDGETQASCASCGDPLTTLNQADCGTEGMAIDCCQKCWEKEVVRGG